MTGICYSTFRNEKYGKPQTKGDYSKMNILAFCAHPDDIELYVIGMGAYGQYVHFSISPF